MARTKHLSLQLASFMLLLVSPLLVQVSLAQNCGSKGGARCQSGYCCSIFGYCGTTSAYCGAGNCDSQCPPSSPSPTSGSGVGSIVTSSVFDRLFPQRNSFYTYDSFITAAKSFGSFGTTGSYTDKARDIAAFFAHVSHETSSLVYINEIDPQSNYCDSSNTQYPCAAGQKYYGRGPLQISWNYNYGPAGKSSAIGKDLLHNPGLVAQDPVVSFKTALWFWTNAQSSIPSCHNVMVGKWSPSAADASAGRKAGFGLTIDIVNGNIECGKGPNDSASDRIKFYRSICSTFGVDPGSNLDCQSMKPFT